MLMEAKIIGAGLATIGSAGAGVGAGIVWGSFILSVARNPSLRNDLFPITLLSFALTEALALFCFMIAFTLLFAI